MSMTNEEAKAWIRVFELAGISCDKLAEDMQRAVKVIAQLMITKAEEWDWALREVADMVNRSWLAEEPEKLEAALQECDCDTLPRPNYWELKELRARRRDVNRETTARLRQYRARESAWSAQKRSGPRRREWRGPWKENE